MKPCIVVASKINRPLSTDHQEGRGKYNEMGSRACRLVDMRATAMAVYQTGCGKRRAGSDQVLRSMLGGVQCLAVSQWVNELLKFLT